MVTHEGSSVRPAVVAGSWYPGTEHGLKRAVDGYLSAVGAPRIRGEVLALISPHAGYSYSGQTAAHAYQQLRDREIATVVVMGPSHRQFVGDFAVSGEDVYESPLGMIQLDRAFIAALAGRIALRTVYRDSEHSLEIQLPFLQRVLGDFRLVPIMIGTGQLIMARRLASALAEVILERPEGMGDVLLVASSDLHHVEDYDEVIQRDRRVVDTLAAYDLETLAEVLTAAECSVCGRMPILTALHAAKALGANAVKILHYTNSGDVTGQRWPGQYTVGYVAAAIYTEP